VALTAVPDSGSFFTGWSGGGCSGTDACEIAVDESTTVSAGFAPIPTPTASTAGASLITNSTATLEGAINGQGFDTHYLVQYGETEGYGSTAPENNGVGEDAGVLGSDTGERVNVTALTPNTTYHYRFVAYNVHCSLFCPPSGRNAADGSDARFKTLPLPPSVITGVPVAVTSATAMVDGEVDPQGGDSMVRVEYGTSEALGSSTTDTDAGSGGAGVYVTVPLSALEPGTTYYYRIAAHNSGGEEHGHVANFTTNTSGPPNSDLGTGGFAATSDGPPIPPPNATYRSLASLAPIPPVLATAAAKKVATCAAKAKLLKNRKRRAAALKRCVKSKRVKKT
jgi:hypothetical protein